MRALFWSRSERFFLFGRKTPPRHLTAHGLKTGLSAKSDEPELRCDEESISAGSGAELRPQRANSASWVCHFPFETVSVLSNGEIGTCCEGVRLGQLNLE